MQVNNRIFGLVDWSFVWLVVLAARNFYLSKTLSLLTGKDESKNTEASFREVRASDDDDDLHGQACHDDDGQAQKDRYNFFDKPIYFTYKIWWLDGDQGEGVSPLHKNF